MFSRTHSQGAIDSDSVVSDNRRSSPSPILPLPAFSTGTTATSTAPSLLTIPAPVTGGGEGVGLMIRAGSNGYPTGSGSGSGTGTGTGTGEKTAGTSFDLMMQERVIQLEEGEVSDIKYSVGFSARSRTTTGHTSATITPVSMAQNKRSSQLAAPTQNNRARRTPTPPLIDFVTPASPPEPNVSRMTSNGARRRPSYASRSPSPRSRSPSPSPDHLFIHRSAPNLNSTRSITRTPSPHHAQPLPPTKLQELLARMQRPIPKPEISPSRFRTITEEDRSRVGGTGLRARRSNGALRRTANVESGNESSTFGTGGRDTSAALITPSHHSSSRIPVRSQGHPTPSAAFTRTSLPHPHSTSQLGYPSSSRSSGQSSQNAGDLSPIQGRGIWRDGRSKHGFPPPSPSRGALLAVAHEEETQGGAETRGQKIGAHGRGGEQDLNGYRTESGEEGDYSEYRSVERPRHQAFEIDRTPETSASRADATLGSARVRRTDKERSRDLLVDLGSANGASSSGAQEQKYPNENEEYPLEQGYGQMTGWQDESDSDSYLLRQRRISLGPGRTPRAGSEETRRTSGSRRESAVPLQHEEEDSPPPRIRIRPKRRSEEGVVSPENIEAQRSQRRSPNPQLLHYLASHPEPPSVLVEPPAARQLSTPARALEEAESQAPSTVRGNKKWVHSSPQQARPPRQDASGNNLPNPSVAVTATATRSSHSFATGASKQKQASPQATWASPNMESFARGVEERADRTAQSVDFEASVISGIEFEDQSSQTEEDDVGPAAELDMQREETAIMERSHERSTPSTPSGNRSNTVRVKRTPQPLTPDLSPVDAQDGVGGGKRNNIVRTATPGISRSVDPAETPFKTAPCSPASRSINASRNASGRPAVSQSVESTNTSTGNRFRPFVVRNEADLPDLPVPEDDTVEIRPRRQTSPARTSAKATSPPRIRTRSTQLPERSDTPVRSSRAPDITARTPQPPGAWASVAEDRKVRFSPQDKSSTVAEASHDFRESSVRIAKREQVARSDATQDQLRSEGRVDRFEAPQADTRTRAKDPSSQLSWRDTLREIKRDVGKLKPDKPLPDTPSDTPEVDGEDPTFSNSLAEIEARLTELGNREGEHFAREKVEVATRSLRNGIAALARWKVGGERAAGTEATRMPTSTESKPGWLPYIGKRAFYAWAIFRLVIALSDRDVNHFDPFLLSSPQQPFLQSAPVLESFRDSVYAVNQSSGFLSAFLTNSGVLELFLRNDGMIPRRLPV